MNKTLFLLKNQIKINSCFEATWVKIPSLIYTERSSNLSAYSLFECNRCTVLDQIGIFMKSYIYLCLITFQNILKKADFKTRLSAAVCVAQEHILSVSGYSCLHNDFLF